MQFHGVLEGLQFCRIFQEKEICNASNSSHDNIFCRFMSPLTSSVPMMVIEGNHEIEPQAGGLTFVSYESRFSVPAQESGSNSNLYYSFNAGGIHFIMLGAYVDYNQTGLNSKLLSEEF